MTSPKRSLLRPHQPALLVLTAAPRVGASRFWSFGEKEQSLPSAMMVKRLRGVLFVAFTALTLVLAYSLALVPGLLLYPWRGAYTRYVHLVAGSWHAAVALAFGACAHSP